MLVAVGHYKTEIKNNYSGYSQLSMMPVFWFLISHNHGGVCTQLAKTQNMKNEGLENMNDKVAFFLEI